MNRIYKSILCSTLILVCCLFIAGCSGSSAPEAYSIADDSATSITGIVGNRNLWDASTELIEENGMKSLVYRYKNAKNAPQDIIDYVEYLRNNGFLSLMAADLTQPAGIVQLGKSSTAEGKSFIITISYSKNAYDVQIDQANVEISSNT